MFKLKLMATGLLGFSLLGLLAAPVTGSAQSMATRGYEVTITNLTPKQVFSPILLVTHPASMHVWQQGQLASDGVRLVAEEGENAKLISELKGVATDIQQAPGPLMPGKSVTLKINAHEGDVLSAIAMLVQTNDGFTGLDNNALSGGMVDKETVAYDAGTEENTEKASDVPGPPFNGHMHGVPTVPQQPIGMHAGIMGKADVGPEYGWTGPVARFSVEPAMSQETPTPGTQPMEGQGSMPGGMPNTGAAGQDHMGQPAEMPHTGAGDNTGWFALAALGGLVFALAGLALTRASKRAQ